jgi:hypothetical protein
VRLGYNLGRPLKQSDVVFFGRTFEVGKILRNARILQLGLKEIDFVEEDDHGGLLKPF